VPTALVAGASRGLGLAIAAELLGRDWQVVGTVRGTACTGLHDLAERHPGRAEVETLDIDRPAEIAALRDRLAGRTIDLLFVNAGTTTRDPLARVGDVDGDEFAHVMITNAYSPMRVIEALQDLVPRDGMIGVMSSGQGSIANNETGMREVYRASKAALNMLLRSFAARPEQKGRSLLALAPGWIRTDLGGESAPYTIEESAPILTDLMLSLGSTPGLRYVDRFGKDVPW
jgi:NAD(P)-dependent dehydrogenase (short-subunit alcohol dehydrogenase family)